MGAAPDEPAGWGRCRFCALPLPPGDACCYCCRTVAAGLGVPPVPVVAAAVFRPGDAVHRMLRRYKDAPVAEARSYHADRAARRLALLAGRHGRLRRGRPCGAWDVVATVPSSRGRSGSPVDDLVGRVPDLAAERRPLLVRGPGRLDHLVASVRGFAPGPAATEWRGARVLVVDDTYTTGARAQSAAAALRRAGLVPVGIAVVGHLVAPPGERRPRDRACPKAAAGPLRA